MKKIFLIFLLWRIGTFVISWLSPLFIPVFGAKFPYFQERLVQTGLPHAIWSFGNFDGVHYLSIAQNSYSAQYTQAFFPLYPIVVKVFSLPFNYFLNEKAAYLISALLVSNLSFLFFLIVFFNLIKIKFDEKVATWSLIFLVCFPTSFYFGAVYSESLFLLLITSAYYLAEKNKFFLASILGGFSASTRVIGVFLAPTLKFSKNPKLLLTLLIIPTGLVLYIIYLKIAFNNPLYFINAQNAFGNQRSTGELIFLPQVIFRYIKIFMTTSGLVLVSSIFEFAAAFFAYVILFLCFGQNKIKREWIVFSLIAISLPTLTGTLSSMPRYILVAFPIYIYLATVKNTLVKVIILTILTTILTIATAAFSQGYWVA